MYPGAVLICPTSKVIYIPQLVCKPQRTWLSSYSTTTRLSCLHLDPLLDLQSQAYKTDQHNRESYQFVNIPRVSRTNCAGELAADGDSVVVAGDLH